MNIRIIGRKEPTEGIVSRLFTAANKGVFEGKYITPYLESCRWRKCSEELPTENDYYLVTNGGFVDFEYGCYNEQDEEWQWDHNGKWQYWMPMPNPPKEDT